LATVDPTPLLARYRGINETTITLATRPRRRRPKHTSAVCFHVEIGLRKKEERTSEKNMK